MSSTGKREITKRITAPNLSGLLLRVYVFLLDYVPGLASYVFSNAGFTSLRNLQIEECPTNLPLPIPKKDFDIEEPEVVAGLEIFEKNTSVRARKVKSGFLSVSDFHEAYLTKKTTPLQVCEILMEKIEESSKLNPPLNAILKYNREDIIKQATASTDRYTNNRSLGPLDGVPIAVKDEMDVKGYETSAGTSFINKGVAANMDGTIIKKLKRQGAIIIGKTRMHEIGLGITGNNPSTGTPRNPYNVNHYPGGSSGGSAASVASGLCPIAVGCDGGGSIRIPSSFCGIYGLKTTFGRFSAKGGYPLDPTVAVSGPMAVCADDLALAYYAMAGKDEEDPTTDYQPEPTLASIYDINDLSDLKIGIYPAWNEQVTDQAITLVFDDFIEKLKSRGAKIIEIDIPDLEEARVAHVITIGSEIANAVRRYKEQVHKFNNLTRSNLALFNLVTASDYIIAQQVRTRFMRNLSKVFKQVDLILTPSVAITAPKINPRGLKHGEEDLASVSDGIRFATFANFSGVPAISVPAGYNDNQLPIGVQFVAKWFDEATLLRMAKVSEEILGNRRRRPNEYWFGDLIQE